MITVLTGDCLGWYNEAERMELAMEGLLHHRNRTWHRAAEEAATAGLHPRGAQHVRRGRLPTGLGILWVGRVQGDNNDWQMASMTNLTLEEAITRITISTQVDAPGTKIILRRRHGTEYQSTAPKETMQAERHPDQATTPPQGASPAHICTEAVTSAAQGQNADPRSSVGKDERDKNEWNKQQLSLLPEKNTARHTPPSPPTRRRQTRNRSGHDRKHTEEDDAPGGRRLRSSPRRG